MLSYMFLIKSIRLPQFISSLPSKHSDRPLHRLLIGIHWPVLHRNVPASHTELAARCKKTMIILSIDSNVSLNWINANFSCLSVNKLGKNLHCDIIHRVGLVTRSYSNRAYIFLLTWNIKEDYMPIGHLSFKQ